MQSINLPSSVKIRARHIGKQLRKYSDILHPRKDLDCNSRDPEHTMTILLSSPTQTMLVKLTREDKSQDSCSHSIAELSPGPADVKTASFNFTNRTAQQHPTNLYCDNKSAISITHNPEHHTRSKHIEVKYYYLRDKQIKGTINISHVPSESQIAFIFTKPLPATHFCNHRSQLGVVNETLVK